VSGNLKVDGAVNDKNRTVYVLKDRHRSTLAR
jgi:hypothetical protein